MNQCYYATIIGFQGDFHAEKQKMPKRMERHHRSIGSGKTDYFNSELSNECLQNETLKDVHRAELNISNFQIMTVK